LNPDSDGFGELCFTMLDPHAIITLPRYAIGDMGKLLTRQDIVEVAKIVGGGPPWLPVVAVKGRMKDRPTGMPSVESIKELIYSVAAVADQLTGAFRIAKDDAGGVKLSIQASTERAAGNRVLRQQLIFLLDRHQFPPLDLQLLAPLAFPYRPLLDYERKFAYMGPGA
jgi:phenylacetate-CoA ligase